MKTLNNSKPAILHQQSTINHQPITKKQKKTITILIYSLAAGGAERQVSYLLKSLSKKYKIKLVLMNNTIFYDIPKNVEIIFIDKSNPIESGLLKLLKIPILAYRYSKIKSEVSLSFMNRPNYINVISNFFKKSKTIICERAFPSLQHKNGFKGFINRFLIKKLYKKADVVVCNSYGNKNDLEKNFNLNRNKTRVIYNAIDIQSIYQLLTITHKQSTINQKPLTINHQRKTKNQKPKTKNQFIFITIGRIDKGKNHNLLVEAIKDIDAELWIIGKGELKEKLLMKIDKLKMKNKIKFLGCQKNPYKFLARADCFIFSSNYEGFPNVLLEALACGLPIISTDCFSGPREILAPGTEYKKICDFEIAEYGILTPVNNVEKMRQAMVIIMDDKNLREKYRQKALCRVKDFEVSKIVKEWERLIILLNEGELVENGDGKKLK